MLDQGNACILSTNIQIRLVFLGLFIFGFSITWLNTQGLKLYS